jgi:3D (Asp-Asp-Asp) domain-containing protein
MGLTALVIAVTGFVLLNEARTTDSRTVGPQSIRPEYPTPGSSLLFSATAYCKGTTTASGIAVRSGIAAADPALLPIGSVVALDAGDASYDGVYTVLDTGPLIKGRKLDLYIWSCFEALRFGRRNVRVTVLRLGWNPEHSSPELVETISGRGTPAR